jgi:hypothetical protein
MRLIFTLAVLTTTLGVLHGDMRPSRPRPTVSELAEVKRSREIPRDISGDTLINRPVHSRETV